MLKQIIRQYLNKDIYNALYNIKIFLKRAGLLFKMGGKYISFDGFIQSFCIKIDYIAYRINPSSEKKIIWLGAFPPMHSNMGDHAQTLAVEQYFNKEFPDYRLIGLNRNQISLSRLKKISLTLGKDDLVFIHSSGDFGSKYHDLEKSYCKLRKDIIRIFYNNKVINLPTTVYYENNERGKEILEEDTLFYKNNNITILARESVSSKFLSCNFECNSRFFPDFVFYFKPRITHKPRRGALFLLRSDNESGLSYQDRNKTIDMVRQYTELVHDRDILKSAIPVIDMIRERYIESICRIYQHYEFVITDRMHGMIIAVITNTPCIALNGGIPHKIKAYQSFLSESVEFIDAIEEIGLAIKQIRNKIYHPTDMSQYFEHFKNEIMKSRD